MKKLFVPILIATYPLLMAFKHVNCNQCNLIDEKVQHIEAEQWISAEIKNVDELLVTYYHYKTGIKRIEIEWETCTTWQQRTHYFENEHLILSVDTLLYFKQAQANDTCNYIQSNEYSDWTLGEPFQERVAYFNKNKLFRMFEAFDCGAPFDNHYRHEIESDIRFILGKALPSPKE